MSMRKELIDKDEEIKSVEEGLMEGRVKREREK